MLLNSQCEEARGLTTTPTQSPTIKKKTPCEQTKPRGQAPSEAVAGSGSAIKVRFSAKGTPEGTVDAKDLLDVNEETMRLKKVCLELMTVFLFSLGQGYSYTADRANLTGWPARNGGLGGLRSPRTLLVLQREAG